MKDKKEFQHLINAGSIAMFHSPTSGPLDENLEYPLVELKVLEVRRQSGDNWIARVEGLPVLKTIGENPYISVGHCNRVLKYGDGKVIGEWHSGYRGNAKFSEFPFQSAVPHHHSFYRVNDLQHLVSWMIAHHPKLNKRYPHAWDYHWDDMTNYLRKCGLVRTVSVTPHFPEWVINEISKKRLVKWMLRNQHRFIKSEETIAIDTRLEREAEQRQYYKDMENESWFD